MQNYRLQLYRTATKNVVPANKLDAVAAIHAEMADIRSKAIANGTYMKAPNGEKSNLKEAQWLHVRTKSFKEWFGDWERLAELENILNSNKNSNFAQIYEEYERRQLLSQRFSQKELSNGDRITEEAESIIQRGKNSSNPELQKEKTGNFQKGLNQEKELEEWAKSKGLWIENTTDTLTKSYGKSIAEGGESVVYNNGEKVVKEISLAYFIEPQLALDRIILHNSISDAKLTVTNFGRNENGEFVIIAEQSFVEGIQLTQEEIVEYMKSMGFSPYNNRNTEFSNGEILINDLHEENVIKTSNGSIIIIDADFRLNTSNYGLGGKRTTTQSSNLEDLQKEYEELKTQVSKVINKDTHEPLVVYSGRPIEGVVDFSDTLKSKRTRASLTNLVKKGVYFSSNKNAAKLYQGSYVIENPLDLELAKIGAGEDGSLFGDKEATMKYFNMSSEHYDALEKRYYEVINDPNNEWGEYYPMSRKDFKGEIIEAFLNIKNPAEVNLNGNSIAQLETADKNTINNSEGAIIKNVDERIYGYQDPQIADTYIAFNPNQIKSATINLGTYSNEENDIRYAIESNEQTAPTPQTSQQKDITTQALEHTIDVMGVHGHEVYNIAGMKEEEVLNPNNPLHIIGEKGAEALDALEQVTTRLDNLKVAQEMEAKLNPNWNAKEDENALKIKIATGWEKGKDGKWRYEISDILPKEDFINLFLSVNEAERKGVEFMLSDIIEHES